MALVYLIKRDKDEYKFGETDIVKHYKSHGNKNDLEVLLYGIVDNNAKLLKSYLFTLCDFQIEKDWYSISETKINKIKYAFSLVGREINKLRRKHNASAPEKTKARVVNGHLSIRVLIEDAFVYEIPLDINHTRGIKSRYIKTIQYLESTTKTSQFMEMFDYETQEAVANTVTQLKAKRDKLTQELSDDALPRIFKRDGSEMFAFGEVKDHADKRVIIDRIETAIEMLENDHDYNQIVPLYIVTRIDSLLK